LIIAVRREVKVRVRHSRNRTSPRFRPRAWLTVAAAVLVTALASVGLSYAPAADGIDHRAPAARSLPRLSPLATALRSLRLVNYFPADNGWQYMWTRWNPGRLNADFATMAALGAGAVRITVFPGVTGFPVPSAVMRSRLAAIVGLAGDHGLKVQLSLFDQFTDFADISGSLTWARDLLGPLRGSSRIAFIDLRNELDAPTTLGRAGVYRWVDALLPAVKRDAGPIPVTLSVSEPRHITAIRAALRVQPDFWDLHYYSSAGLAYATMERAIRAAAPRPVFVGETGFATTGDAPPGLPAGEPSMEAYQAYYYQVVEQAALSLGLGAAAPWTLYDFSRAAIPGKQQPAQYAFGLLHANGTRKPAAAVIRRLFTGGGVSRAFNANFGQAVATPSGALPSLWRLWQPGQASFGWDSAVGHDARGSARIQSSRGVGTGMPGFYTGPVQPRVTPGVRYRVTAWVRGHDATGRTVVNISWLNANGVFLGGTDSAGLPAGGTPWTELAVTAVAPPGAAAAQIWLKSAHDAGTVWFDDVTWTRAS
jgi:hypothetical protein